MRVACNKCKGTGSVPVSALSKEDRETLESLAAQPKTSIEIGDEFDLSGSAACMRLARLVRRGYAARRQNGTAANGSPVFQYYALTRPDLPHETTTKPKGRKPR